MKPVRIPANWTADQAQAVFQFLSELADAVWAAYDPLLADKLLAEDRAADPALLNEHADSLRDDDPCPWDDTHLSPRRR